MNPLLRRLHILPFLLLGCLLPISTVYGQEHVIDFEGIAAGEVVSSVTSDMGLAGIEVKGSHSNCPIPNAAVIFDSNCPGGCSGNDPDLGSPNETFGGPGVGRAGEAGQPHENADTLNNILIVHAPCGDLGGTSVADPNDYAGNWMVSMDFPEPVLIWSMDVIDVESDEAMQVKFFDDAGAELASIPVDATGDNGTNHVYFQIPFVSRMEVDRKGSGAIDNIKFEPYEEEADVRLDKELISYEGNGGRFEITVTNEGSVDATGIVFEDRMPGIMFPIDNQTGTDCVLSEVDNDSLRVFQVDVGDLAAGQSFSCHIDVGVDANEGDYPNVAEIIMMNEMDVDSTPGNNLIDEDDQDADTLSIIPYIDLSVEKIATIDEEQPTHVTFEIIVSNAGPENATGVVVEDRFAITSEHGREVFNTQVSCDAPYEVESDSLVTFTFPEILAEDYVYCEISVDVDGDSQFINVAEVMAADQQDIDSTPGNDMIEEDDQDEALFGGTADLRLWKTVDNAQPSVEDEITFTITVVNDGPDTAGRVVALDSLSSAFTLVEMSGTVDSTATEDYLVGALIYNLAAGDSVEWHVRVRVDSSGTFVNAAQIAFSSQYDPDSVPFNDDPTEDDYASVSVSTESGSSGKTYALNQNYPNPFNPITQVSFLLEESMHIELAVFDMLGRKRFTIAQGNMSAGLHSFDFDATGLPSGVYLYRLKTNQGIQVRKMNLLR